MRISTEKGKSKLTNELWTSTQSNNGESRQMPVISVFGAPDLRVRLLGINDLSLNTTIQMHA